jgi:hypothetical protein
MALAYFPPSTSPSSKNELSRLLTAAVVNRGFCKLLLTNPASALERGYNGESFRLGREERDLILSIRAKSLAEFAMQLAVPKELASQPAAARKGPRLPARKFS